MRSICCPRCGDKPIHPYRGTSLPVGSQIICTRCDAVASVVEKAGIGFWLVAFFSNLWCWISSPRKCWRFWRVHRRAVIAARRAGKAFLAAKIAVNPGTGHVTSEICSYCNKPGHWRPDCPEIAKLMRDRALGTHESSSIGSSFDSFLEEDGILEECKTTARASLTEHYHAQRHAAPWESWPMKLWFWFVRLCVVAFKPPMVSEAGKIRCAKGTCELSYWLDEIPELEGQRQEAVARANRFHRRAQRAESLLIHKTNAVIDETNRQLRGLEDVNVAQRQLNQQLGQIITILQNHLVELRKHVKPQPASAERCGSCPHIFPGPEQDCCNVFGDELKFVGKEDGGYIRLGACKERSAS